MQLLMETDVEGVIGAGRHERTGDRTTYRNGYRDRTLETRLGALQLRIPKRRQGRSYEEGRQRAALCQTVAVRSSMATKQPPANPGRFNTLCRRKMEMAPPPPQSA